MDQSNGPQLEPVRLVAANVVAWRRHGVAGQELRPGTKFFKGGAKEYVADAYWGPGDDRITSVGRERHTGRWIVIDMATRKARRARGFISADHAADVSATLEQYACQYRAETAPYAPHPDRCLCHACLTGESG
ncbi:hypothetical protein [Streptomyces bambusae]|uniref:Uncharacterized protein n=1 Tax=Streptomyces bambusae TaxID=1550616 RepID=A0ABS6Z9I6_9ACTN|nr:hypothetical protein [Streptomyces bambusae]MBW5484418.1 hypothetical protein [Streptomyces bambusae]